VKKSSDPLDCVAKGTGIVCENLSKYKNIFWKEVSFD
jgi:actin-like ATPase involved in cell morphogenesis